MRIFRVRHNNGTYLVALREPDSSDKLVYQWVLEENTNIKTHAFIATDPSSLNRVAAAYNWIGQSKENVMCNWLKTKGIQIDSKKITLEKMPKAAKPGRIVEFGSFNPDGTVNVQKFH